MNNVRKQKDEGFTIIEVVLVLAIAALIMLMVFIALPALQRNQRDTTRKNDISRLQSTVNNYKSTNRGSLPTLNAAFITAYMQRDGDQFADPAGEDYTLVNLTGTGNVAFTDARFTDTYSTPSNAARIFYRVGRKCYFASSQITGGCATARKVAIAKGLEGGGVQCVEA